MTSLSDKLEYKRNIDAYLTELSILTGDAVTKDDISTVNKADEIRANATGLVGRPISKFEIAFSEKNSPRFSNYIRRLAEVNDSGVYVWTKKTNFCGLFKNGAIDKIDFSFPFEVNQEGLVVFLSSDMEDKLLLDFSMDSNGNQILEVETQGKHWPRIVY